MVIRVSLCVEGNTCFTLCCMLYVFLFVFMVIRDSLCVQGYTCFTLC